MILFPDMYYKNVQSIDLKDFEEKDIKGIAIDVDNTLIDYKEDITEEVIEWVKGVKEAGYKICILSNSSKKAKVERIANIFKIDYIMDAKKPLKAGFKKAIQLLDLPVQNIAVIGDQIFTDVWGANKLNMVSVYVEPINKKEFWYTKWKRPIESLVLRKRRSSN